jgi:hypothetical protein
MLKILLNLGVINRVAAIKERLKQQHIERRLQ